MHLNIYHGQDIHGLSVLSHSYPLFSLFNHVTAMHDQQLRQPKNPPLELQSLGKVDIAFRKAGLGTGSRSWIG